MSRAEPDRAIAALVVAATVAALGLRLAGIGQSLFGDELFTYDDVTHGFTHVLGRMHVNEVNPPLFYLVAAAAAKVGDPRLWIRIPSLVAGTAAVPLTYLLGVRTVGRNGALVGAALLGLCPFGVFYSTEARGYALLMFLVVAVALALVLAGERGSRAWWVALWAAATAALYVHYTAVVSLGVLALWALWRYPERRRGVVITFALAALAYVPWIPSQLDQHYIIGQPLTAGSALSALERTLLGHPLIDQHAFLGTALAAIVAAGAVLLAVALALDVRGRRPFAQAAGAGPLPLVGLVVAVPLALLVYSVFSTNIVQPRNMAPAVPAAFLLIGAALVAARRPLGLAASMLLLAVLAVGTVKLLGPSWRRPDMRAAAELVDREARPGAPVITAGIYPLVIASAVRANFRLPGGALNHDLSVNFSKPHPLFPPAALRVGAAVEPAPSPAAWRRARSAGRAFVVTMLPPRGLGLSIGRPYQSPSPPAGQGFVLRARRTFSGLAPVEVLTYDVGPGAG